MSGCGSSKATVQGTAQLPRVTTFAELLAHEGQTVRIEGWYEVTPVAGSKALQPACIVLADGTRLLRSYRPIVQELGLNERQVVVIGKAYRNAHEPEYVQQVMAPHVFPDSIELEPSEPPAPDLRDIRTPPTVSSAADLDKRLERWVQIMATVQSLGPSEAGDFWGHAVIRLSDGTDVHARTVARMRWEPMVGKVVSFMARVSRSPDGQYEAEPAAVLCEGRVERCGMTWKPGDD